MLENQIGLIDPGVYQAKQFKFLTEISELPK